MHDDRAATNRFGGTPFVLGAQDDVVCLLGTSSQANFQTDVSV